MSYLSSLYGLHTGQNLAIKCALEGHNVNHSGNYLAMGKTLSRRKGYKVHLNPLVEVRRERLRAKLQKRPTSLPEKQ